MKSDWKWQGLFSKITSVKAILGLALSATLDLVPVTLYLEAGCSAWAALAKWGEKRGPSGKNFLRNPPGALHSNDGTGSKEVILFEHIATLTDDVTAADAYGYWSDSEQCLSCGVYTLKVQLWPLEHLGQGSRRTLMLRLKETMTSGEQSRPQVEP